MAPHKLKPRTQGPGPRARIGATSASPMGLIGPVGLKLLDLLALFVTGAALDRVAAGVPAEHTKRLRWKISVILSGLTAVGPP